MFAKLLKYELKSLGKWYLALNASVFVVSLFLGFSIRSFDQYAQETYQFNANHLMQLIPVILSLIFGLLIAGSLIATLLIIIRRFYLSLFGREGYLTLTLPVSTHQLLLSKLLTAFLWSVFNALVLLISIVLLLIPITGLGNFLAWLPKLFAYIPISYYLSIGTSLITSTISGILLLYLAITIGQLFANRRIMMGIVAYFLITILLMIISELFTGAFTYSTFDISLFHYTIIENLIDSIVFYALTYYLLKYKVNIQ